MAKPAARRFAANVAGSRELRISHQLFDGIVGSLNAVDPAVASTSFSSFAFACSDFAVAEPGVSPADFAEGDRSAARFAATAVMSTAFTTRENANRNQAEVFIASRGKRGGVLLKQLRTRACSSNDFQPSMR